MPLEDDLIAKFQSDPATESAGRMREVFGERLPQVLFEIYQTARNWRVRNACVWYSTGFCRRNETAVDIGKAAIFDKSKFVRFRATELLACSLRSDALPVLVKAKGESQSVEEVANFSAAIDAIERQNHTFFWDRTHTGKYTVNFEAPLLTQ